jgi:carboxylesterase type B
MRAPFVSLALAQGLVGSTCSAYQNAQFSTEGNDILLKLDYATHRGYFNETTEVYTFRNIRYADSPTGKGRWAKPRPPPRQDGIQDRKEAIACTQPPADDVRTVGGDMVGAGSEDCLFLDLTIPRSVFQNPAVKVPVLVWVS